MVSIQVVDSALTCSGERDVLTRRSLPMDPVPWMFGSVLRASLCSHPLCRPGCVSTDRVPEVSVTAVDEEVIDGVRVTCDMNQIEIEF